MVVSESRTIDSSTDYADYTDEKLDSPVSETPSTHQRFYSRLFTPFQWLGELARSVEVLLKQFRHVMCCDVPDTLPTDLV